MSNVNNAGIVQVIAFVQRGTAWKALIALGIVVLALFLFAPPEIQRWLLGGWGLLTSLMLVLGIAIWHPMPLRGWLLVLISQFLYAIGDVVRGVHQSGVTAFLMPEANLYLVGSLFFLAGMPVVYWYFRHLVRRENLPEGLIIGVGFALVSWIVVISPNVTGAVANLDFFDAMVYPSLLVIFTFFSSLYLLTPLGDLWSFRFLFGALAGLQSAAYVQGLLDSGRLTLPTQYGYLPDMFSVVALVCLGVAYLHPSFGKLKALVPGRDHRSIQTLDLVVLAAAFGLAPTIWLIQAAQTIELNTVVVILGMMIVFGLAEWRLEQLFQRLGEQNRELVALDKLKSQFLANMTHELRTPLNSIINFSLFMQSGTYGEVNDEQREALARVSDAGKHLLSMINDVLDLAKIQADMVNLFVERDVSLSDELETAMSVARGLIENRPVTLVANVPNDLPLMVGDRRRIRQIFINLLSNACKFTQRGQVCVQAQVQNENILVTIQDTGTGISEQDRALIFEPFRQARAGLEQGTGSGLGLPIAKSFVEAHHGKLWFESQVNAGTTFFVLLPIHTPALERVAQG